MSIPLRTRADESGMDDRWTSGCGQGSGTARILRREAHAGDARQHERDGS
jgi:hypothetical protein